MDKPSSSRSSPYTGEQVWATPGIISSTRMVGAKTDSTRIPDAPVCGWHEIDPELPRIGCTVEPQFKQLRVVAN